MHFQICIDYKISHAHEFESSLSTQSVSFPLKSMIPTQSSPSAKTEKNYCEPSCGYDVSIIAFFKSIPMPKGIVHCISSSPD